MTFTIGKDNKAKDILIQGKPIFPEPDLLCRHERLPFEWRRQYEFLQKGIHKYDLDYKLRNILIDYFTDVDTVPLINDVRITVEK